MKSASDHSRDGTFELPYAHTRTHAAASSAAAPFPAAARPSVAERLNEIANLTHFQLDALCLMLSVCHSRIEREQDSLGWRRRWRLLNGPGGDGERRSAATSIRMF